MTIQREMKALERTYYHRMNIERDGPVKTDYGLTKWNAVQEIAANLPCAISFKTNRTAANTVQTDGANMIEYAATLFCGPLVDIKAGDSLTVTLENGQSKALIAGEPILYPTHQEVPCIRKGAA